MDMDHGHHGHGDMDMGGDQCSMNMLFTWSTKNLCIVFSGWHVTGPLSLLGSLVVIVLMAAGYEGVRQVTRQYEIAHARRLSAFSTVPVGSNEIADEALTGNETEPQNQARTHVPSTSSRLLVGSDNRRAVERRGKITMAALYAVQVFYSFFIMLLFMTYNGFVMLAVAVGAFVGYLAFGENMSATKSVACH
ncbi:Ctr copper transporter [Aspergillus pseudodeflectus]|uniref:Copper transport protein n=1 Tax=Aspergillus pseudodeflectus TaxID=176178 RepID=A0ABR4L7W8_9EURO